MIRLPFLISQALTFFFFFTNLYVASEYFFKSKEVTGLKNCYILSGPLSVDTLLCDHISEPLVLGLGFDWYLIHNKFLIFK